MKKSGKKSAKLPPPLEEQFEDLILFMVKTSKENEDISDLPGNPPKYEMIEGQAKFEHWETTDPTMTPLSRPHRDWRGKEQDNARECPHCNSILFASAAIGQLVKCLQCGGVLRWCS